MKYKIKNNFCKFAIPTLKIERENLCSDRKIATDKISFLIKRIIKWKKIKNRRGWPYMNTLWIM